MVPRFGGRYSLDRLKLAVDRAGIAFTDTVTGIAFTDTVNARRPTPGAKDARPEECAHGRELLDAKLVLARTTRRISKR
jgi:hypothetical protein